MSMTPRQTSVTAVFAFIVSNGHSSLHGVASSSNPRAISSVGEG
jgi:hypothetical protein